MTKSEDKTLLSRWSRRKLAARQGAPEASDGETAGTALPSCAGQQADNAELAAREAERKANREAAEAVDLTKIDETTDFSVFMKDGVPDILRRKALSVLWRSNPLLANIDGLNDYDEDFARPDLIAKSLKSAWEVGRGYLKESPGETAGKDEEKARDAVADEVSSKETTEPNSFAEVDGPPTKATQQEAVSEQPTSEPSPKPLEEDLIITPEPTPRVSLRRRLSLDENS